MTYSEIVPASEYRSARWHEARRGGVSASEIAAVLDIDSAYQSPFSLYWRKKLGTQQADNPEMQAGRYLEKSVVDWWCAQMGTEGLTFMTREAGLLANDACPSELATPDRVIICAAGDFPLEVKTSNTYTGWGPDGTDEIPVHYRAQVLWQMHVMDADVGHVAVLFGAPNFSFRRYVITRDHEAQHDIEHMRAEAALFLNRLANDDPPPLSGHRSELAVLKELNPHYVPDSAREIDPDLIYTWETLGKTVANLTRERETARDRIRLALGDAQIGTVDGQPVVTRSITERAGFEVKPSQVDTIRARKRPGPTSEGNTEHGHHN